MIYIYICIYIYIYIYIYILFIQYKNERKEHNFDNKNINKSNFHKNNKIFNIYDIEVDKILISKNDSYDKKSSFKYFLGDNDADDVIRPLYNAS